MKISYIIPAYNAEKCIADCINSILRITVFEKEIIVVDDGSFDKTAETVSAFSDKSIKLIRTENKGVSSARNTGINNSTGDYIVFCDADDLEISDAWNSFFEEFVLSKDLYMFDYVRYLKDGREERKSDVKNARPSDILNRFFDIPFCRNYKAEYLAGRVFSFIYNRKFIESNNIRFDEDISYAEDLLFCIKCLKNVKDFEILDKCLYEYRYCEQSAVNKYRPGFWEEQMKVLNMASKTVPGICKMPNEVKYQYGKNVLENIIAYVDNGKDRKSLFREAVLNGEFNEAVRNMTYNNWTLKEKMYIDMCAKKNYRWLYMYHWLKKLSKKI